MCSISFKYYNVQYIYSYCTVNIFTVIINSTIYLQLFFEGVQAKVGAGVKESEVSYQMAFSKQELRRVVKEYPAREVKKGLENLYRKVEKHLCEEENLLQVNEK